MTPTVAILVGGLGTRLGALVADIPKPMIDVAGKPFLGHVIDSFVRCGLNDIVLLTGHRSEVIERWVGDGAQFGATVRFSREAEPMGTGGALRDAATLLGKRFIVTYGDILRRFDYERFAAEHEGNCVAVYPYQDGSTTIGSGNIALNDEQIVTTYQKDGHLPYVDAGFSIVEREVLQLLPVKGACSFESIVYPRLAATGRLSAEIVGLNFYDIGNPADLARTRHALEEE
jgi:NDP-sugar pyrophosphorylase family protein